MKTEPITSSGQTLFLRRRYPLRLRFAKGIMGVVPLADMTFIVVMFLIAHSWVVLKPGVSLTLPTADFVGGVHVGATVLTISRDGSIFYKEERMSDEHLPHRLARAARGKERLALVIQADRSITHERLIQIYNIAQQAGFEEIVLATQLSDPVGDAP